ncbi:MAG: hypothetical protein BGO21_14100 [Dyadobacter sp. 50-39]|uniref:CRISPR-associated helicase Cas3' n=1 Tax=Dyadobacter sp. 50-39 TaxID=1895756 RepID=UPI00095C1ADA|nr:CRISPR-associated helicase Cas3' [Dyadobacter sp. 50-39]OJV22399.1 MAG: hypothetical protein BGO21_14100 [Dyadobacter sp. 50-39]
MRNFYSHAIANADGTVQGSKLLRVHTAGVTSKAIDALFDRLNLQAGLPLSDLVRLICIYHDLGKYSEHFQNYLLQSGLFNRELKQHAKFGGIALYQKLLAAGQNQLALFALYLIVHHHKSLTNLVEMRDFAESDSNEEDIFKRQLATMEPYLDSVISETGEVALKNWLRFSDRTLLALIKNTTVRSPKIENYFLLNYLFSLLIESDKLDASDTIQYLRIPIPPTLVDNRLGPIFENNYTLEDLRGLGQNALRSYVRSAVVAHLEDPTILDKKLFTLTAPTGIGKTLTALDFALRLRELIRVREGYHAQIVYALPFINIIEQSIQEYRKVLGEEGRVLAHYQYADAMEQLSKQRDDEENGDYNQKTMLLDTWQSDVVITTFVQFLQTLIGNRNKLLKKFHHLAGAIVVLDEVQTIRLEQLPLIGAALFYVAKHLNTRVILMTATKPKTFDLAEREIIRAEGDQLEVTELLTNYEAVFQAFKRTQIVPLIDNPVLNEDQFINNYYSSYWTASKSCLIVCNLVARSINVFEKVRDFVKQHGDENPVYYLSTNIVPAHRLRIIEQIKRDLKNDLKPILVATQCVEAGVDLDFDMGFRDLGPIDSIIQVAGRINRENSPERSHSPLYVIDFSDCIKIYDPITDAQARHALRQAIDALGRINEENYLKLIGDYYDSLSAEGRKSFDKSRKLFASMKRLNYDNSDKETFPVSSFQVIDHKGYAVSAFVELDNEATMAKEAFLNMLSKKISREEFDTKYKLAFNQRIITVPKYLGRVKELIQSSRTNELIEGLLIVNSFEIEEYYDVITGFRRDKDSAYQHSTTFI